MVKVGGVLRGCHERGNTGERGVRNALVHRIAVGEILVHEHGRDSRASERDGKVGIDCEIANQPLAPYTHSKERTDQVLADDNHADSSRPKVLLSSSVDDTVLGDVDRAGEEIGGHVANDRDVSKLVEREGLPAVRGVGRELDSIDRLVVAVVNKRRLPPLRLVAMRR